MSALTHPTGQSGEIEEDHTVPLPPIIEKVLAYDKASLDDPQLNEDRIFVKLRECL